jgi:hypothetical protein
MQLRKHTLNSAAFNQTAQNTAHHSSEGCNNTALTKPYVMKRFLLSDTTQAWINLALAFWIIIGLCILFAVPSQGFEKMLWYPVSVLVSIIAFLSYNVWVSDAINRN